MFILFFYLFFTCFHFQWDCHAMKPLTWYLVWGTVYPTHHSLPLQNIMIEGPVQVGSMQLAPGRDLWASHPLDQSWFRARGQGIRTTSSSDGGYVFTRQFTISTSRDDINWSTIHKNGEDVVFDGNIIDDRFAIYCYQPTSGTYHNEICSSQCCHMEKY